MPKHINVDENVLSDYLFSGVSFSTFRFDEISYLSCKYVSSRIGFIKKLYLKKIASLLNKNIKDNNKDYRREKYFAFQEVKALKNASVLISSNDKEIAMYQKMRGKKDIIVSRAFEIDDLPVNARSMKACLFLNNDDEKMKYKDLINYYENIKVITIDSIGAENLIYDQIKVELLQDERDIYFVSDSFYANYIVNSAYSVNKIAIHL